MEKIAALLPALNVSVTERSYVYMTAGGTKFLRIYYGRVRDCLKEKGIWDKPMMEEVDPG